MKIFEDLFVEFGDCVCIWLVDSIMVVVLDGGVYVLGKKFFEEVGEVWLVVEYEFNDVLVEEIS